MFIHEKIQLLLIGVILVHNGTIFFCSLDVGNIVKGGEPLYASKLSPIGKGSNETEYHAKKCEGTSFLTFKIRPFHTN